MQILTVGLHHADWLLTNSLQKMVLVISSVATKEVLERWTFDIRTDKTAIEEGLVCSHTPPTLHRYPCWLKRIGPETNTPGEDLRTVPCNIRHHAPVGMAA